MKEESEIERERKRWLCLHTAFALSQSNWTIVINHSICLVPIISNQKKKERENGRMFFSLLLFQHWVWHPLTVKLAEKKGFSLFLFIFSELPVALSHSFPFCTHSEILSSMFRRNISPISHTNVAVATARDGGSDKIYFLTFQIDSNRKLKSEIGCKLRCSLNFLFFKHVLMHTHTHTRAMIHLFRQRHSFFFGAPKIVSFQCSRYEINGCQTWYHQRKSLLRKEKENRTESIENEQKKCATLSLYVVYI